MKKTATTIILLFAAITIQAQGLRVPDQEHFIINVFADYAKAEPSNKNSKYGLNYVIEAGITSAISDLIGIEVKVGLENFPQLQGGYFDAHAAIGIKKVFGYYEEWNYYAGIRLAKVYRTGPVMGKTYRCNIGWEGQIIYYPVKNIGIGLRGTIDGGNDMEIMGWAPKTRYGGWLVLQFKIFEL